MTRVRELLTRLFDVFRRDRLTADFEDEIRFHHAMLETDARAAGASAADARRRAQRAFGNRTRIAEDTRAVWTFEWLESVWQDARYALRSYARTPGFTTVVLVTLALGIGATTAIFSAVDGVLLRPLPYPNADRLVAIWPTRTFSAAELEYVQSHAESYDGKAAAFSPGWGSVITLPDHALQISGARTSTNFFPVLGVTPALGRTFAEGESAPGHTGVIVLSWELWRTAFGADSSIVGRSVSIDGAPAEIIGVMSRGFTIYQPDAQLWMPLEVNPASSFYKGATAFLVGRLARGVTQVHALAELRTQAAAMRETLAFEDTYGRDVGIASLQDTIVGPIRQTLIVLFAAVGFLVLIAGANVANLLLARAGVRRREVAVRNALGASRARVVRQMLVESIVLAATGGVLGFICGAVGLRALKGMLPASVPRLESIVIDVRVMAVAAAVTLAIGVLFGIAPALLATNDNVHDDLRAGRGGDRAALGRRLRRALVVAEIALAVVLVTGAGLMSESMWHITHVSAGFKTDHVLTLRVQASGAAFPTVASRVQYVNDAMRAARAVPGVETVGAIQHLPLSGFSWQRDMEIEGRPQANGAAPFRPGYRTVAGDYFGVMNIPVVAGRGFEQTDDATHPIVAVVNEQFAKTVFPGESAIGKRIKPLRLGWITIVGVVGDVHHVSLTVAPQPEFFLSMDQVLQSQMQIVVRTAGSPASAAQAVFDRVSAVSHSVPVSNVRTLAAHTSASVAQPRVVTVLMLAFAVVGLALGAVGTYGVVGYTVANREREIGIRLALGANRARVVTMLAREGIASAGIGVGIGVVAAFLMSSAIGTLLFGVAPTDRRTYTVVAGALLFIAALASWLPARRALRADPMNALRSD